jgi:hypothetical protein
MESDFQDEQWREVPFDKNYMVSTMGRVKSLPRVVQCGPLTGDGTRAIPGKILQPWLLSTGYLQVALSKSKRYSVHRIVLETFVGPCPPGMEAAHNDGDRANARLDNLRWATKQGNMADKILHGTNNHGEKNNMSKLSSEQVKAIRSDSRKRREVAKDYGITPEAVSHIVLRKNWKWLE